MLTPDIARARLSRSNTSPRTTSVVSATRDARFSGRRAMQRTGTPEDSSSSSRRPPTYPVAPVSRVSSRDSSTRHRPGTAQASVHPDDLTGYPALGRIEQPGNGCRDVCGFAEPTENVQ